VLVGEAVAAVGNLLTLGVRFDTDGGDLALTREGGHSRARIVHAGGDATGAEVERALIASVRAAGHVHVAEHAFLVDLLTDASGAVTGAVLERGGTPQVVRAGAVVLASGGAGQLFPDTTNPPAATGDGIAAALRAGAELADLEFVQFHPTALHLPGCRPSAFRIGTTESVAGRPRLLLSEALRGEGAVLRDPNGDPVMDGVHPLGDLAPRDVVSRAMATRMTTLGRDHLLLDATGLGAEKLERRFPTIVAACRAAGLDPATSPLPVSPAAHYLMGGIRTDLEGRTSLPGLWAVGEAACTGVHGANRLASNSLLEGAVFAARAARALTAEDPHPSATQAWAEPLTLPASSGRPPAERAMLRAAMGSGAGVVRSAESLARAASVLAGATTQHGSGSRPTWETINFAQLGTALVHLAARREESRGAHWRHDHPEPAETWSVRQTITRSPDGTLATSQSPAPKERHAADPVVPDRSGHRRPESVHAGTGGIP
jgi:L-aspartate oxidase